MKRPLVVVGDALLDRDLEGRVERLCPEAPVPVVDDLVEHSRPGGAALAAALAAADGRDVTLVTALADDQAAAELRALVEGAGVRLLELRQRGATAEKVRVRTDGRLLLRLDHGGRTPGAVGDAGSQVGEALAGADVVLVADYGRGVTAGTALTHELAAAAAAHPLVWDPHPRGARPVAGARLATPNRAEARLFGPVTEGRSLADDVRRARELAAVWQVDAVAVTLGEEGAVLAEGAAEPVLVPGEPAPGGDPCGAGDRFASAAAAALADGASVLQAVEAAVGAASAFVAAGGAASVTTASRPSALPRDASGVVARARARGGTVVATGGCFDLLHAGHVRMLEAARALGDCLVVLLNSDESVRRLKGADRPLVPEEDRAAVLGALACVDAVVVFDEDTPEAALERLRPDVWAKGGDYTAEELPETEVLERYGGRVAILPYVAGRSTSRLIEEAALRGGR